MSTTVIVRHGSTTVDRIIADFPEMVIFIEFSAVLYCSFSYNHSVYL